MHFRCWCVCSRKMFMTVYANLECIASVRRRHRSGVVCTAYSANTSHQSDGVIFRQSSVWLLLELTLNANRHYQSIPPYLLRSMSNENKGKRKLPLNVLASAPAKKSSASSDDLQPFHVSTECEGQVRVIPSGIFLSCSAWKRDNQGCNIKFTTLRYVNEGDSTVTCNICAVHLIGKARLGWMFGEESGEDPLGRRSS